MIFLNNINVKPISNEKGILPRTYQKVSPHLKILSGLLKII